MWNRTVKIKIKGQEIDVMVFLDSDSEGMDVIRFLAMINEYFLEFTLYPDERDLARSLIQRFPVKTLKDKMCRLADENGVFNEDI